MTDRLVAEPADLPDTITEGVALQSAALRLLCAEMQALAAILQVSLPHPPPTEAEIDAEFENMPV
jgi:hypothetical protein